jgi:3-dehydrosphinganine reductase
VLINNAGVAFVGEIETAKPDEYRRMMDINYFGTVWTTLSFLPHFREQEGGIVAAVSSTLGQMGLYGYSAYAASKYALTGFMDCLRQDLLKYGIQVTVLFPADTDTPQLHAENKIKPAETKALASNASMASPEDVARTFLEGLTQKKYHIAPGFENAFILWANHKMPSLVRWFIDRDLKKFWKEDTTHQ